jgi:GntR family transcriptional regulator/MocR family aminotransferase
MSIITLELHSNSAKPLYQQLYEHIKSEILLGKLPTNYKLPSIRQLSSHLECSRNTVKTAYQQLDAEGYIEARPRSGYYVCKIEGIVTIEKESSLSYKKEEKHQVHRYDFTYHGVDQESFPFSTWRKITKDVINEYDTELLQPGHPAGCPELRTSIADYLRASRGVDCRPDQIIISSGTEYLLQILIQLFSENYVYAIENPGYEKINLIFRSNRVKYKAVPLDASGMQIKPLLESNANAAIVTPSHQFPSGTIMPADRRIQLINWANAEKSRYIIEDDYDGEFRYHGRPIPSLHSLDKGGKVIYIGAFSKSLAPTIRISYMVLPKRLMKLYFDKLSFYICPVPVFEQKVLSRFIRDGYFERHLNRMRKIYREKRSSLVSCINKLLPAAKIKGANAGLHLILEVDNGMSEDELIESAKNKGTRVFGYSQYYFSEDKANKDKVPRLLLGFSSIRNEDIHKAVETLRNAWFIY